MIHELVEPDDLILHERPELFDFKYQFSNFGLNKPDR